MKYHERTVLNFPRPVLQVHVCFRQRPQETTQFKEECVEQNLHTPQGQLLLLYVAQTRKPIVPASESGGEGGGGFPVSRVEMEVFIAHVCTFISVPITGGFVCRNQLREAQRQNPPEVSRSIPEWKEQFSQSYKFNICREAGGHNLHS